MPARQYRAYLVATAVAVTTFFAFGAPVPDSVDVARTFCTRLAEGRFEEATHAFDAQMAAAIPADRLEQIWASLEVAGGKFQGLGHMRRQQGGPFQIVFVECRFARRSLAAKVVVNRRGNIGGLWFVEPELAQPWQPADYVDLDSFTERHLQVEQPAGPLPATLSVPTREGPLPAIVLVHGSGPHDRDETIGPNKPFRDLAWGLASRGVAVLRYDKRALVYPEQFDPREPFTVKEEVIDDAAAAVQMLRRQPEVDPGRVFLLGHSLGGTLVPRIAAEAPEAAGFIVMAATLRSLPQAVIDQVAYLRSLSDNMSAPERQALDRMERDALRALALTESDRGSDPLMGVPPEYYLDLKGYHTARAAAAMERPLLVLQGARDYQVTMADFAGWRAALAAKPNAVLKSYPNLNHLFMPGTGMAVPAEYEQRGHVDAAVIEDISEWLRR